MQQLHLVGFTTDLDSLILSSRKGAKSGSFAVPLDERLLGEIAEAIRRRNDGETAGEPLKAPAELMDVVEPTRRSSKLSPREIQARLRSGRSIPAVAREAAADEEWVANFAPPVLAERSQVISAARELSFSKPRLGQSADRLGMSVRWNLADRGIRLTDEEFDECWDAFHIADTTWAVTFDLVIRGRRQHAEWEVDLRDVEDIVARNRVASDFGYLEHGRRRRPALLVPDPPPAKPAGATRATSAPAPVAKATRPAKASRARVAARSVKAAKTSKAASKNSKTSKASKTSKKSSKATKAASGAATKVTRGARAKKSAAKRTTARGSRRTGGPPPRGAATREASSVAIPQPLNELARKTLELVERNRPPAPVGRTTPRSAAVPRPPPARSPLDLPLGGPQRMTPPPLASAPSARREPPIEEQVANAFDEAEELSRQRRDDRRRARAAARGEVAAEPEPAETPPYEPLDSVPPDEGRVVTIRASKAGGGDVVVRGGRPTLRPALPASQPKRRRFGRTR